MSNTNTAKNKRIAKNTFFLYIRMLCSLALSLYTSRIVLQALGAEDLGIYYIVSGVFSMFAILTSTMANASQRFISYELGEKGENEIKNIYSLILLIHGILALIVVVLAETAGYWFLNNYLNIPLARISAANYVFQISLCSCILSIISVPFTGLLFAFEKIAIYAYFTLLDIVLKLLLVVMLLYVEFDKLILYSLFMFSSSLIIFSINVIYCRQKFPQCRFSFIWNMKELKKIFSYTGWSLLGNFVMISNAQITDFFINIFFNTKVNAAKGIGGQLKTTIFNFITNMQVAMNPAIIKSYAEKNYSYTVSLVYNGSRYCFLLCYLLSIPLILYMNKILTLWLGTVPTYTVEFCRLILINGLIDSMVGPLVQIVQATGKLQKYQLCISIVNLSILPINFLLLYIGCPPYSVLYVNIFISIIVIYVRLSLTEQITPVTKQAFFNEVILYLLKVVFVSLPVVYMISFFFDPNGIFELIFNETIIVLIIVISIYLFGMKKKERYFILNKVNDYIKKIWRK